MLLQVGDDRFFSARIDAPINLNNPLVVLARRLLPWDQIEASLAAKFGRRAQSGVGLNLPPPPAPLPRAH
jgi:hypothetical protein